MRVYMGAGGGGGRGVDLEKVIGGMESVLGYGSLQKSSLRNKFLAANRTSNGTIIVHAIT